MCFFVIWRFGIISIWIWRAILYPLFDFLLSYFQRFIVCMRYATQLYNQRRNNTPQSMWRVRAIQSKGFFFFSSSFGASTFNVTQMSFSNIVQSTNIYCFIVEDYHSTSKILRLFTESFSQMHDLDCKSK